MTLLRRGCLLKVRDQVRMAFFKVATRTNFRVSYERGDDFCNPTVTLIIFL